MHNILERSSEDISLHRAAFHIHRPNVAAQFFGEIHFPLELPWGEASLGSLLQQGFNLINQTPRLMLVPGVVIVLLSLSFNAVADGIRDALANKERIADVGAQA